MQAWMEEGLRERALNKGWSWELTTFLPSKHELCRQRQGSLQKQAAFLPRFVLSLGHSEKPIVNFFLLFTCGPFQGLISLEYLSHYGLVIFGKEEE